MGRPLDRGEIEKLADSIRALLADPDAGLNEPLRRRWEGTLTALEVVLGERSSFWITLKDSRYKGRTLVKRCATAHGFEASRSHLGTRPPWPE